MTVDDVVAINRDQLASSDLDEPHQLLSADGVHSAVQSPRNVYGYEGQRDLLILAVLLMDRVAKAHAFLQGNKRTAYHAAVVFLERNGAIFAAPDIEMIAALVEKLIARELTVESTADILRPFVVLP